VQYRASAAAAAADAATADAALFDATRDVLDAAAAAAAAAQGGACDLQICPVGAFLSRDPQCHLTEIVGRVSVIDLWNTRSKLLPRKWQLNRMLLMFVPYPARPDAYPLPSCSHGAPVSDTVSPPARHVSDTRPLCVANVSPRTNQKFT